MSISHGSRGRSKTPRTKIVNGVEWRFLTNISRGKLDNYIPRYRTRYGAENIRVENEATYGDGQPLPGSVGIWVNHEKQKELIKKGVDVL